MDTRVHVHVHVLLSISSPPRHCRSRTRPMGLCHVKCRACCLGLSALLALAGTWYLYKHANDVRTHLLCLLDIATWCARRSLPPLHLKIAIQMLPHTWRRLINKPPPAGILPIKISDLKKQLPILETARQVCGPTSSAANRLLTSSTLTCPMSNLASTSQRWCSRWQRMMWCPEV